MTKRILHVTLAVLLALTGAGTATAADPVDARAAAQARLPSALPFAFTVTQRKLPMLHADLDYPVRQVVIDGELWMIFVPGRRAYGGTCPVLRFKGKDLEHLERQPDGTANLHGGSGHLGCGMWWEAEAKTLYGLIHTEYAHNKQQGWCSKRTRLATSTDLGLTWTLVGDILTRALPKVEEYTGSMFEAGPADFDFYTDVKGGYFYVTSWNSFTPKKGKLNGFLMYSEVARCAIADKMAPGKWFKFRDGAWTEPGLGGKASRIGFDLRGIYGNTIYSSHLKKYLRIGVHLGIKDNRGMPGLGFEDRSICISTCTDLAKQDWSPMAKLLDEPRNELFGFTLMDGQGVGPASCGQTLRAYNYWHDRDMRVLEIALKEGTTPVRHFTPYDSYAYEPHPESGDRIAARKTRLVGAAAAEMKYDYPQWAEEKNPHYYEGQAKAAAAAGHSVQFTFQGPDIYWRAVAAKDGGKADVTIDGAPAGTVDCFFQECALPYQFAYIKTGLDPKRSHTIKIVVRGDKNPLSSGTIIRHVGFERAADLKGHGSNPGYSPVCPAYPGADFRGMREWSANIIYSILRTQRIGRPNVPDSPNCNRTYGFGLSKLEKLSLEWLQTPKGGENIHASLENRPFLPIVTKNGLNLSHA
jgi:hypothetical protein